MIKADEFIGEILCPELFLGGWDEVFVGWKISGNIGVVSCLVMCEMIRGKIIGGYEYCCW